MGEATFAGIDTLYLATVFEERCHLVFDLVSGLFGFWCFYGISSTQGNTS
jgi:hypothetical protein